MNITVNADINPEAPPRLMGLHDPQGLQEDALKVAFKGSLRRSMFGSPGENDAAASIKKSVK